MVATYTKPTTIPRWADTSLNIVEPPELKKDEGWLFEEIPPSSYENWRTNLIGSWVKWLDERLTDGASPDDFWFNDPGTGTPAFGVLSGVAVYTTLPLRFVGDDLGLKVAGTNHTLHFTADDNNRLSYSTTATRMELYAGGVLALWADATGTYINGDLNIGDDLSLPGGLAVGIATPTIVDDVIQLGDADLRWEFNSGNPRFIFDHFGGSIDAATFDRTNNRFGWTIANVEEMRLSGVGLSVADGLQVGFVGTPIADRLEIGDANLYLNWGGVAGTVTLNWDSTDYWTFDRSTNVWAWFQNSVEKMRFAPTPLASSGMSIDGGLYVGGLTAPTNNNIYAEGQIEAGTYMICGLLRVGFTGSPTGADKIEIGDTDFLLQWHSSFPYIKFDTGGEIQFSRASDAFSFKTNNQERMQIYNEGAQIALGLIVGYYGTVVDDAVYVGDNKLGLDYNSGNPKLALDTDDYLLFTRASSYLSWFASASEKLRFTANGEIYWPNPRTSTTTTKGAIEIDSYTGKLVGADGTNILRYVGQVGSAGNVVLGADGAFLSVTLPANTLRNGSTIRVRATAHGVASGLLVVYINGNPNQVAFANIGAGGSGAPCHLTSETVVLADPGASVQTSTGYYMFDYALASYVNYTLLNVATNAAVTVSVELVAKSGAGNVTLDSAVIDLT